MWPRGGHGVTFQQGFAPHRALSHLAASSHVSTSVTDSSVSGRTACVVCSRGGLLRSKHSLLCAGVCHISIPASLCQLKWM